MQSREELLATLRRLEKNPATAHLMVRATKGRKVAPQERLLKRILRGAEVATQVAEEEFRGPEGSTTSPSPTADCPAEDKAFREKVTRTCEHEAATGVAHI